MKSGRGWLGGVALALLFGLTGGCELGETSEGDARGPGSGASDGGIGDPDASYLDSGTVTDGSASDAGAHPPFTDGIPADNEAPDGLTAACYPEAPEADPPTCGSESCFALPGCCLGQGDCCAPIATDALPSSLDFAPCEGSAPDECLDGLTAFGPRAPSIAGDTLFAGGDADYDSGLLVGGAFDATTYRAEIAVTFSAATGCGVSCLESAGLAFTDQTTFSATTVIRPVVGLLLGGSDNAVRLIVADRVVASRPMASASERWSLVVRPSGEVTAMREGQPVFEAAVDVARLASGRLVLFGRNRDATELARAGMSDLTIETQRCERPEAFRSRTALTLLDGDGAPLPEAEVDAPSLATDGVDTWLAFVHGGQIRLARREADTTFRIVDAAFSTTSAHEMGGRLDPALHWNEALSRLQLFYTAVDGGGRRSIGRADLVIEGDATTWVPDAFPRLHPDALAVRDLESPTVARAPNGVLALLARATGFDDRRRIEVFRSTDDESFSHLPSQLATLTNTPSSQGLGADADEIARPALALHNGAWLVHVGLRRGTRGSIALLSSDDLLGFRSLGEVFEGSGAPGFDRLSVRAPFFLPGPETLALYYVGWDGTRSQLGRAVRPAAPGARYAP